MACGWLNAQVLSNIAQHEGARAALSASAELWHALVGALPLPPAALDALQAAGATVSSALAAFPGPPRLLDLFRTSTSSVPPYHCRREWSNDRHMEQDHSALISYRDSRHTLPERTSLPSPSAPHFPPTTPLPSLLFVEEGRGEINSPIRQDE